MFFKNIDCRGLDCPQPIIETKKALENFIGVLTVKVDNNNAKNNILKFASSQGCDVYFENNDSNYDIKIIKQKIIKNIKNKNFDDNNKQTIMLTKNTFGEGSAKLGLILIKSFLLTILESEFYLETLIFINTGVKLVVKESPVLKILSSMAEKNIEILVCGTCLDFYNLTDQLFIGEITNMYKIVKKLSLGRAIIL